MWLIKKAHVVDPAQGIDGICDVLFDEFILAVGQDLNGEDFLDSSHRLSVIEADGKYLFPGLIDVHAHLREPGREDKEDITSGAKAAVRGGFTTVLAMANTQPVIDNRGLVEYVMSRGEQAQGARVLPVAAVTMDLKGDALVNMAELHKAGAVAFSDDGRGVQRAQTMLLALQYAQLTGCPLISHCEDESLAKGGCMRRGFRSARLGLTGIPAAAESVMAARDILLAQENGGKLHLAHLSTAAAVAALRWGKQQGIDVTGEVNPHHLIFSDDDIGLTQTCLKVNPPLPSAEDRGVLLTALVDGTIDMLATDHAPHTWEEKARPFPEAPFGINGFETALAAVWMSLVEPGKLSVSQLVRAWSLNPARRFGLAGGSLHVDKPADIVLFDPKHTETIGQDVWLSKSTNTPYWDKEMHGFPTAVWVGGSLRDAALRDAAVRDAAIQDAAIQDAAIQQTGRERPSC
ncbi:MAG: dihydroorotase [Peptococcaceae bacterium]|nr:dihydroorotase [Peptococcaceae bacterium]